MLWPLPIVFVCLVFHGVRAEEDHVIVLTDSNFEQTINENDFVLVEFYSPSCPHCLALEPEYKKAASILNNEQSPIILAKVDATEQTQLAEKHEISGYPTIKFFNKGKAFIFEGDREAESIVKWVKKKADSAVKELTTVDSVKDFIKTDKVVVIGFLKESQKIHLKIFTDVSTELDEMSFALVSKSEIFKEFGISKDSQIVVFKQFDEGRVDYTGGIEYDVLIDFLKFESVPLVVEFSASTTSVFSSPVKLHLIAFISKSKSSKDVRQEMHASAKKFKGKVHFILVDIDIEDHLRILEFFSVLDNEVPTYRMINFTDSMPKYKPDHSDFTEAAFTTFVDAVLTKKQAPFFRSQEIPTDTQGPVRVLVGKNYNDVVFDKSRSVFVKLYAPWCGHCKQLAPKWDSLGEAFKDSKDVLIAKMDATANEAEGLTVHSYPTLYFYPKDSDSVIDYSGERSIEALKKFVESGGTVMVKDGEEQDEEEDEEEEGQRDEL